MPLYFYNAMVKSKTLYTTYMQPFDPFVFGISAKYSALILTLKVE